MVTLVGLSIPTMITGTLIIEQVFNYPGAGLEYFNAALRNDYEVMLGITVLVGVVTVLGNLLADIGYAILDPRIRYYAIADDAAAEPRRSTSRCCPREATVRRRPAARGG